MQGNEWKLLFSVSGFGFYLGFAAVHCYWSVLLNLFQGVWWLNILPIFQHHWHAVPLKAWGWRTCSWLLYWTVCTQYCRGALALQWRTTCSHEPSTKYRYRYLVRLSDTWLQIRGAIKKFCNLAIKSYILYHTCCYFWRILMQQLFTPWK